MSRTYLAGYWGNRQASLAESASALADFLTRIAAVTDDFTSWYLKGDSPRDAMRHRIATDTANLEVLLSAHLSKAPDRNAPIEGELGFSFEAWNGRDSSLSLTCGRTDTRFAPNVIFLKMSA